MATVAKDPNEKNPKAIAAKELQKRQDAFVKELQKTVGDLAVKHEIGVNLDYDERGSTSRFSLSLLKDFTEPGIGRVRSYT